VNEEPIEQLERFIKQERTPQQARQRWLVNNPPPGPGEQAERASSPDLILEHALCVPDNHVSRQAQSIAAECEPIALGVRKHRPPSERLLDRRLRKLDTARA
jgi:hypothetical protein